jgi:peptidoglycan/LPS O-acetylase OafA/YrhL
MQLMTWKPVRWIGLISYTSYLIHTAALALIRPFSSQALNHALAFAFIVGVRIIILALPGKANSAIETLCLAKLAQGATCLRAGQTQRRQCPTAARTAAWQADGTHKLACTGMCRTPPGQKALGATRQCYKLLK